MRSDLCFPYSHKSFQERELRRLLYGVAAINRKAPFGAFVLECAGLPAPWLGKLASRYASRIRTIGSCLEFSPGQAPRQLKRRQAYALQGCYLLYSAITISATSSPTRSCASTVEAPICGVNTTLGCFLSASFVVGSSS